MRLQRKLSLSYLFVAHDLLVVHHIPDGVVVIYLDVVAEEGIAEEIFAYPGHAYTGSLLSAIPVPDPTLRVKPKRAILEADVHSPLHLLKGFLSSATQWPKRPAKMKAPIGRNLAGTSDLLSGPSVAISSTNLIKHLRAMPAQSERLLN